MELLKYLEKYEYIVYPYMGLTGYFTGDAFLEKINYLGAGKWKIVSLEYKGVPCKEPVTVYIQ